MNDVSCNYETIVFTVLSINIASTVVNIFHIIISNTITIVIMVHWPLMGGLLHLVQRGGDLAGPQPAQAPPHCTKCNGPPIIGQCTNHCIAV